MVIEWLKVKVPIELHDRYIEQDAAIWTTALANCAGFVGKQVWTNSQDPTEIILVIQWATREQWKAIPIEQLESIDRTFVMAMGQAFPLVETGEYHLVAETLSPSDLRLN
ncbi:TIGR03792 family protein [Alkalinema sp. FACHB-956]|uniref:TIGR03792 family protein n=1 Tax=Alkalinema sp. FACHB-956 TaxID=2692768 RepID=UPI0016890DEC|nr:TIGR03792 family protein [Alkalinema sp. FACHB-956]MBD2325458.1 TIGR03792 family protein [Alkalinema sp. FACHB-956]